MTRVRFKGVGASPGFKESVSGVGLDGGAPRTAGDERRPPGADGNGGEAMPGGGGARGSVHVRLGRSRLAIAQARGEEEWGGRTEATASGDRREGCPTAQAGSPRSRAGEGEGERATGVLFGSVRTPASRHTRRRRKARTAAARRRWHCSGGD
uniref:Uncharacterized protein n=1 Tax=Oryza sativa subsp. japonica TaxID=39947 RepID=Q69MQ5_ORYSJ|nr:hypothetical protein [Oryza sativa Japonica Group]